ncbi:MAG: type I methionyl aminopeptidase [Candidatus Taylorbacteria bacterium]
MITIKTKEDIAILREGGKRHAFILRELAKMVKPNLRVIELEDYARKLIAENVDKPAFLDYQPKGSPRPYPAALCVSINNEVVHGIPNEPNKDGTDKILKEGDIVSMDLGLIHKGLITDSAVTVAVGKVSDECTKLMKVTKEALMAGIKAARAGKRVGAIGEAVERVALAHGYGVVEDLSGHGVGYEVHEDPYVPNYGSSKKGAVMKPGMVLAIEPMFNLGTKKIILERDGYTFRTADGRPSAHFEHTIVITKSGAEILTA